jgi:YbbR domain-containing protein
LKFDLNELIRSAKEPKDENFRNRIYVFLVCLGISVFLWFLIGLSKNYYGTVEYPIKYENVPNGLVLTDKPDSLLSFRVTSGGFELAILKYLTRKKPIVIDLRDLKLRKVDDEKYVTLINTSDFSSSILNRLNLSEKMVSVSPETIEINFESLARKMVRVIPDLSLEFEKMYQLVDSVRISPDSVEIAGSLDEISRISSISTIKKNIQNINKDVSLKIPLDKSVLNPGVSVYPEEVSIDIIVEKFTEASIKVPISAVENDTMRIKTFPEDVKITYLVSLKNFNRVDTNMFLVSVDFQNNNNSDKLKVKVINSPPFVKITKVEPEKVEYLVFKK